ncbi:MAG: hypothetical protein U1E10_00600 [Bdellovibrionales bacterium]|nr:hypothetical protein [Bdellovibrionales bacterium]
MRQVEEVAEQGGMRWLIVALVVAGLLGTLARLMIAPHKVEMLVRAKVATSVWSKKFEFRTAEIDLADGPLPDFALILKDVGFRPAGDCRPEGEHRELAPIRATSVRVPLKWTSLFQGRLSAGRIEFEELKVDIDEAKRTCAPKAAKENLVFAPAAGSATAPSVSPENPRENLPENLAVTLFPAEELAKIAQRIGGFRFLGAEVFFENRMKSVVLEDAVVSVREREVDISTTVRFPPATVFGETIPAFSVIGTIRPSEILADVRADLNEGTFEANAVMRPLRTGAGEIELDSQLKLTVSDLPLSMMTPLLIKSGVVQGRFRPKFAWLDCNAEIKGIFSRLFVDNPVRLSTCEISGQAGRVRADGAIREPSGKWQPFDLALDDLDLGRVFETFELEGPSGVFAEYGKLTAKVKVASATEYEAVGRLKGAILRFAGGEGTALQTIDVNSISMKTVNSRFSFQIADFVPAGGTAELSISANYDLQTDETEFDFDLVNLKLNPRVEKVVFTGPVASIKGQASGVFQKSDLSKLKASLVLADVKGSEFSSMEMRLEAQLAGQASKQRAIELTTKSALVEVQKSGHLFSILKPALLGWTGVESEDGKRVTLNKVSIKGRFKEAGFYWSSAQAAVGGVLSLVSEGQILRDQVIEARLEAGYPGVRRLAWDVRGTWRKPEFAIASDELRALLRRPEVQIPNKPGNQGVAIESAVVPLRYLGIAK